jgi:general secretion pathway protein A
MGLTGAKPLQRLLCQRQHMYQHFYGLQDSPFALTPDPTYLFLSASHKEALASMIYGVHERKGFVLIVGEVGTGKTTLIRHLLGQRRAQIKTAFIDNTAVNVDELLQMVLHDFEIPCQSRRRFDLEDWSVFGMQTVSAPHYGGEKP